MKDIIYLGHTTMTHGLKGYLKFYSAFERKDILLNNNTRVLIDNEIHTITKCSYNKNYMLIIIDNLKDINLVEEYRNKDIYIIYTFFSKGFLFSFSTFSFGFSFKLQ